MRQACRLLLLALPQGTQLSGGLGQLKLRQRRGGVRQRLAGLLLPGGGLLLLLRQLVAAGQPLELLLLALLLGQQGFFFVSKYLQTFLQRLLLGLRQQDDARRLGFELLQRMASGFVLFVDHG
ncbi:Uncharacterised protein [Klebsiella pneumoniae]|nr:Uncharacterised protein [Klebsiella pneumoniae]